MTSVLLKRAGRLAAAAPAGAAAAACATSAYFGQRGSANATARTASSAAARLQSHLPPPTDGLLLRRQLLDSSRSRHTFSTTTSPGDTTIKTAASAAKPSPTPTAASANATSSGSSGGATTSSSGGGRGFLAWYEKHLEATPVQTKMATGALLWGLGDAVAQIVPHVMFDDDDNKDNKSDAVVVPATKPDFVYDYARTARASFFGLVIHAPLAHVHYNFLEWMTVRAGITGMKIPVFKAFMEQFVYWSWFSNSLYHGAMGAMQGMSAQQIYDRIADVLWDTQKAQWAFWIPVQLLNFQFVPVRHQLNIVLLTSIVWTALLSAWYPPAEAPADDEEKKLLETERRKDS